MDSYRVRLDKDGWRKTFFVKATSPLEASGKAYDLARLNHAKVYGSITKLRTTQRTS